MKKLLVLVAMVAALAACSKKEDAPVAAPAAPTAAAADMPKECNDYLEKVSACVRAQSGAAADAMKQSMEQTKASWAAMSANKDQLGAACKAASDAFAAQAMAMKC